MPRYAKAISDPDKSSDEDDLETYPLTLEGIMRSQSLSEMFPEWASQLRKERKTRGRPKSIAPKVPVTLRLKPETLALFKLKGEEWRFYMTEAVEKAALKLLVPGNPHPGKVLHDLFMGPRNLTAAELARQAHIDEAELNAFLREEKPVTAGLSIFLASYFEVTPRFWLSLQLDWNAANPTRVPARKRKAV